MGRACRGVDAAQCEQALAAGVPAVAFTDHLDFTTGTDGDRIAVEHIEPRPYSRMHLLDVPGYLATVQGVPPALPGPADPHRRRDRRGPPVGRERCGPWWREPGWTGSSARCTPSRSTGS